MIAQNSEVCNPPTYLSLLYTYMEKDLVTFKVFGNWSELEHGQEEDDRVWTHFCPLTTCDMQELQCCSTSHLKHSVWS